MDKGEGGMGPPNVDKKSPCIINTNFAIMDMDQRGEGVKVSPIVDKMPFS